MDVAEILTATPGFSSLAVAPPPSTPSPALATAELGLLAPTYPLPRLELVPASEVDAVEELRHHLVLFA